MAQVRLGVDAVDCQIVALIAHRSAFMDAAARINRMLVSRPYEDLTDSSIAPELQEFDRTRG